MSSAQSSSPSPTPASETDFDAVVVGAGFAGLYMLHKLRGMGFRVRVFEEGSGVGGTWFWNRYPGARCDVESMEYSYQFDEALQQGWEWTERYATQPEILRYLDHVADRFDLRRDIQLETQVTAAHYDEATGRWTLSTDDGGSVTAGFCVMATGCMSARNIPDFKGVDSFAGATYHTGDWPQAGVDFTGQRVGVIGTGSSGIQAVPLIAEQAKQLFVFQRTPSYSVPAHNKSLSPEAQADFKAHYAELRAKARQNRSGILFTVGEKSAFEVTPEERAREFEARWALGGVAYMGAYADLFDTVEANDTAAEFVRSKIREIVSDPEVAERLSPDFLIGCKRLCVDTDYYATYNRDNVTLVDVSQTPIKELTPAGLRVGDEEYELDAIVFATGFDAVTGALTRIDIRGRDGLSFAANWEDGARTLLGVSVAGFPNLFMITGPGSPSVLSNMVQSIEQHVEFIADCLGYMREHGHSRIEATPAAQDAWVAHVNEVADRSVYPLQDSWYIGSNIPGKARVFLSYIGFPQYVGKCDDIVARGYAGFSLG
jgi:cation diffusion facilitator CzcD-associated flavoprotein CzcO